MVLGSVDDSASAFGRVSSALRLADGVIAVADPLSSSIHFFDTSGSRFRVAGGSGEGPGEFRSLTWIRRASGLALVAYDRTRRASVFDQTGRLIRTGQVPGPPVGTLSTGEMIFSRRISSAREELPGGLYRDSSLFLVARDDAWSSLDTLGMFPNSDPPYSARVTSAAGALVVVSFGEVMPYGRIASVVISGEQVVHGDGGLWELRYHDRTGRLTRIVRRDQPPERITDRLLADFIEAFVLTLPEGSRAQAGDALEDFTPRRTVPAFGRVLADEIGRLWVRDYKLPGPAAQRWTVLSPLGAPLGTVLVPADLEILDVGRSHVLGLRKGPYDIDQVLLFALLPG